MSTSAIALSAPAAQASVTSTINTTRHCARLFPDCANMTRELPFAESVSAIIRISEDAVYRGETQRCDIRYRDTPYILGQDMVRVSSPIPYYETFVSDLPVNQNVGISIGPSMLCIGSTLKVASKAGIYTVNRVTNSEWSTILRSVISPLQITPTPVQPQQCDLNNPFALVIGEQKITLTVARELPFHNFYSLKNTTDDLHILFFKIVGNSAQPETDPVQIAVPVVVPPHDQRLLPMQFFHQSYKVNRSALFTADKGTNFFDYSLLSIVDTVATIEP